MARRPDYLPRDPRNDSLTRDQLNELQRSLALLSPDAVRAKYRQLADRCRLLDLPTPRVIQELVATWRVLWRWRK